MPTDKKQPLKGKAPVAPGRGFKQASAVYSRTTVLLEEAITQMNAGKYGRSSSALKELLAIDPHNMEARRLFATLHLRLGSLTPAKQAFDSLIDEAFVRQDYWLAESLLREYLAAGPRCVPYLEKLASIYQDKGEIVEAVEQYGKAIDILAEDPDSDNPTHASQLYKKIISLAPMSLVARRVAGYFDAQTGALIPQASADAAADSTLSDEGSADSLEFKPGAESVLWAPADEPLPVEEAVAAPEDSGLPPDASRFEQQLEEVAEAVENVLSVSDATIGGSGSGGVSQESAPVSTNDATAFAVQQVEVPDGMTQEIQHEEVENQAPLPILAEELYEANSDMPGQVAAEPSGEIASEALPDQALPGLSSNVGKGGVFSWDSLFSNDWNANHENASSANTPATNVLQSESLLIPKQSTAEASSAGSPMPWDQVQESTIPIPDGQLEDTTSAVSQEESVLAGSFQSPVSEQDHPLSLIQLAEDNSETAISASSEMPLGEFTFQGDISPSDAALGLSAEESQDLEVEQPPHTLLYESESPKLVEESSSTFELDAGSLSSTGSEAALLPHEDSFSLLKEEPVEVSPEVHVDESPLVVEDELDLPVSAGGHSEWMAEPENGQIDGHSLLEAEFQQEEPGNPVFCAETAATSEPAPNLEEARWNPAESIGFIQDQPVLPVEEMVAPRSLWEESRISQTASSGPSPAHVCVQPAADYARETDSQERTTRPRPQFSGALSRIGTGLARFIVSCFSTTRSVMISLMTLVVSVCVVAALGVGVIALTWLMMEESPSSAYHSFTASPQHTALDSKVNGYALLLGIAASAGQHAIQEGDEQRFGGVNADNMLACLGSANNNSQAVSANASEKVLSSWFRGSDPVGTFLANRGTISRWTDQGEAMLGQYRRWQRLPFEDQGYGSAVVPPCAAINFAHRLYVADGFTQHTDIGINRLEEDIEAWRAVLTQARTLPVKVLAIQAVRDDAAVVSGLLAWQEFDGKYASRLSHMVRPLSQAELSMRWPMQSELVRAAKTINMQLKAEQREGQPLHAAIASMLPLPSQRRLNNYAAYYEAANTASEEGRHGALPKLGNFIKFPAVTAVDYFTNPIENVIGLDPLPSWDSFNGLAVDADAHLRLASLQAWIRRGWQDAELLSRIAKAGQAFYDPYTGLPMLVNQKKHVLYSVGHDFKDQDGDPEFDVVVAIPGNPAVHAPNSFSDPSLRD